MNDNNIPASPELPSVAKLIQSTFLAMALAAIILLTCVLPAEYGIDPTGVGTLLGLTKMGEIKTTLAQEVAAEKANKPTVSKSPKPLTHLEEKTAPTTPVAQTRTDEMTISLKPNEGQEIKLKMEKETGMSTFIISKIFIPT